MPRGSQLVCAQHGMPPAGDSRRLEVVVDGLPLFSDRQLVVDTTLVSSLKGNGEPMTEWHKLRAGALGERGASRARSEERIGRPDGGRCTKVGNVALQSVSNFGMLRTLGTPHQWWSCRRCDVHSLERSRLHQTCIWLLARCEIRVWADRREVMSLTLA